jgi:hypothetical protein
MKFMLLSIFFHLVLGAPFESLFGNILKTFQFENNPIGHDARRNTFVKRKSNNWRVNSYTPGVDTDSAPRWTLNNQYAPPQNEYSGPTNIKTKADNIFGFLPDFSLPQFDKIFSDLHVRRNDVENAIQELVKVPSFSSVAETVQNYFQSGGDGTQDGLTLLYENAVDRQDVEERQGDRNRNVVVGIALLLSLLTGGSIGTVITEVARNAGNNNEVEDEDEDFYDGCGFYYGEGGNGGGGDDGDGDEGGDGDGDGDEGEQTKSWFGFRRKREAQYLPGVGIYPGVVCPPNYDYEEYPYGIYYNYNGYGNGGNGNGGGGNGGEGGNGGGGSNDGGGDNGGGGDNSGGGGNGGGGNGGGGSGGGGNGGGGGDDGGGGNGGGGNGGGGNGEGGNGGSGNGGGSNGGGDNGGGNNGGGGGNGCGGGNGK